MPTWFCKREIFERVGGFDEGGKVSADVNYISYRYTSIYINMKVNLIA